MINLIANPIMLFSEFPSRLDLLCAAGSGTHFQFINIGGSAVTKSEKLWMKISVQVSKYVLITPYPCWGLYKPLERHNFYLYQLEENLSGAH